MTSNIRLSIIIPMYNTAKYIKRCLDSCYAQGLSEDEFEIIVVDDGSTDDSYNVVEQVGSEHRNIRLFHQKNQGQGAARNLGMDKARGKYIEFLDADDYLLKSSIGKVLLIAEQKEADIARFLMDTEKTDGTIVRANNNLGIDNIVYTGEQVFHLSKSLGSVCESLYLKIFLLSNGFKFMTDIKHEDVAFCYSVLPYAKRYVFCNMHCYLYCYHIGSTDRTKTVQSLKSSIYSDLRIAQLLKKKCQEKDFPKSLKPYYNRSSNSILVSSFLTAIGSKSYSLKQIFSILRSLRLIPTYGTTKSWKTTVLIPLINFINLFV